MLIKRGKSINDFYEEHYIDTVEELSTINTEKMSIGSVAFIISTGAVYMLSKNKEWKEI